MSRTPLHVAPTLLLLAACLLAACAGGSSTPAVRPDGAPSVQTTARTSIQAPRAADVERVRGLLSALSDDSLEGRGTGTRGSARAARLIALRMREAGLEPGGDSGYFQRVPMALGATRRGTGPTLAASFAALDTVPAERRLAGVNVVGVLRGSDPALRDEVVLVDAHYDHLGVGAPETRAGVADSIYNGADDDASGTVAVLEIARALGRGPRPGRTVVFLATTGEEVGLLGTRWYIAHPVLPLERTVANLEIEMIGRPDSLAGGPGRGWLTGYGRSTMGDALAANGIPIVADPYPDQHFFERSDNIAFARRGIPAHTLSSYDLHADYHTPFDDAARADPAHMAGVISAATRAVRLLADGPKPEWKEGGRP
ncbi:MAG: M20/M25/M40 family metallo-hydrolase [Gemmatimonadaceae bacterium]